MMNGTEQESSGEEHANFRFERTESEQPTEGPDMHDSGGDWGGADLNGIDFGIYYPKGDGGLWSFRFDEGENADPLLAEEVRKVLAEKSGGEIITDGDRDGAYMFKTDPRNYLRSTIIPEAQRRLNEDE